MPLLFQPNHGQADAAATFVGEGPGLRLALSGADATLDFGEGAGWLRLRMIGAAARTRAVGELRQRTRVNYYTRARPITGVPTYARVRIGDVYPGIDVVYYGSGDRLEYDFVVAAGADPSPIRFALDGATSVVSTDDGALRIALPGRAVELRAPVAFQERDGRREPVRARYRIGRGGVSLVLGDFDRTRPLVIDPVFEYATYLGGTGDDTASRVAVDTDGSAYVIGTTSSPFFPHPAATIVGPGPSSNSRLAYLAKLDPTGTVVEYLSYWGGDQDRPFDVGR